MGSGHTIETAQGDRLFYGGERRPQQKRGDGGRRSLLPFRPMVYA